MGAAVGGSIENVAIKGRTFSVAADADADRKLGGFENEVPANGDGTARIIKTRVPWQIGGLNLACNEDQADHEFLQKISNAKDFVPMEVTFASGVTFRGRGIITGELKYSSQNATCEVTLSGPGTVDQ